MLQLRCCFVLKLNSSLQTDLWMKRKIVDSGFAGSIASCFCSKKVLVVANLVKMLKNSVVRWIMGKALGKL